MNTRKLLVSVVMLVSVVLSACASATATPVPIIVPATVAPTTALTQAPNPQLFEYNIPTSDSEPGGIVAGPDGAVWFVETAVNKIGRISTDGVVTEYAVPTAHAIDTDQGFLAVGPDGALWFNEDRVNQIGRITVEGEITEFDLPKGLSPIRELITAPDGALWVTSRGLGAIVKLNADGTVAAQYPLPKERSNPTGMIVGPDKALWFVAGGANEIGRITTEGKLVEYPIPDGNSLPLRLTAGPDDAVWFTMFSGKIGRISLDGVITTFDATSMGPVGITSGADGALWFTGYNSNEIGRMTTDGKLTKIKIPTTVSMPYHITAGPDGNLWFTEQHGNKIGQIQLSAPTAAQPLTTFSSKIFNIPMNVNFGSDWHVIDDYSDLVTVAGKEKDWNVAFNIVTHARVADPVSGTQIPFPDDFAAWIKSNSDFKASESVETTIAGIKGVQIDATPIASKQKDFLYMGRTK